MKQYIINAFSDQPFTGNPAAVCILDTWLPDKLMLAIAQQNNLSETAFAVKIGQNYHLRWFTPAAEIDLCGHATLATAFVIMNFYDTSLDTVCFDTLSGRLSVTREDERYQMTFPSYNLTQVPITTDMLDVIGVEPIEAWLGRDLVLVLDSEQAVRECHPQLDKACHLDGLLLHITAKGQTDFDCVSRSFAPKLGIDEDPVCGSGHCHLAPLWSKKLNQTHIKAYQASTRGGTLYCTLSEKQVLLSGTAHVFACAELFLTNN